MPQLGSQKSRNGCRRCKQRRVKCDEQIPCGYCVRRSEHCSFLSQRRNDSSDAAMDMVSVVSYEDWIRDLELMHHWPTVLQHLGAREKVANVWRDYIPQQALLHPFLMHGLLTFSALHLAYLKPDTSKKYLQLGDKHQAIALRKFRTILSARFDLELQDALFALATILALSCMARSGILSDKSTIDTDGVAELLILTKGIADVICLSPVHIRQSPLSVMLEDYTCPDTTLVHIPCSVASRLAAVRGMLETYGSDRDALRHCQSALTEVEKTYKIIAYLSPKRNVEMSAASQWQVGVSTDYVRLIQACYPPALIVLAYYAAAVTAVRSAWYTQNWAEYVLLGIEEALDTDMQRWIQWPMKQVRQRLKELGVQYTTEESYSETYSRVEQ